MRRPYRISRAQLRQTFAELRRCGGNRCECQVLWLSPWKVPDAITEIVHPKHSATAVSFSIDEDWLAAFWEKLAHTETGLRCQVHTHPGAAFHSATDNDWPIVHTPGFLSLVIPHFAMGEIGFEGAYLAELAENGRWQSVSIREKIEVTP